MKARTFQALTPGSLLATVRQIIRACRTWRARRHCPKFELDEQAAREFLARALRRSYSFPPYSESDPYPDENWTLPPGWNLRGLHADETGDVENLVCAAQQAQVITCTHEGVDIDLLIQSPPGGDWVYQWRVSFPPGTSFALCNPYRAEFRRLGWSGGDRDPKAKGCRTALAVIREAVEYCNCLLDAHAVAAARIPARRRRPGPRGTRR